MKVLDENWVPSLKCCFLPILISVICAVIFFPFRAVEADVFSPVTCIMGGILMCIALLARRAGRLRSHKVLMLTFISFVYECLPINLPTSLDDTFSLAVSGTPLFISLISNLIGIRIGGGLDAKVDADGRESDRIKKRDDVIEVGDGNGNFRQN